MNSIVINNPHKKITIMFREPINTITAREIKMHTDSIGVLLDFENKSVLVPWGNIIEVISEFKRP